jgi:predicted aspartyl protease
VPHFTLQVSPQGAVVNAGIGVSEARGAALTAAGQAIPNIVRIRALIDTGASATCVDPSVLQTLNLTPTGNAPVVTPSTGVQPINANQYDVSLIVPAGQNQLPFYIANLPVLCMALLGPQGFHALIGRDVLAQCLFMYNGSPGWFTLAY